MRKLGLFVTGAVIWGMLVAARPWTSPEIEAKIDQIVAGLPLEQKIGQLVQVSWRNVEDPETLVREGKVGSFLNVLDAKTARALQEIALHESPSHIPLIFGLDVIHGYRTIFPIPLAGAASWDPELIRRNCRIAAEEATAEGVHWTFAPMVDIARDPRWGRIAEGAGEDPFLGSVMARARVKGFQGDHLGDANRLVACAKHFVGYGAAIGGRDYNTTDMSDWTLRTIYLPPFKAAVEAGVATVMSAFNDLNGIPASANRFTLTRILRQEWGFQGFVVSDWNAITELINHGVAGNKAEAAEKALRAGVDMDMMGFAYSDELANLVRRGLISETDVDQAVRRVLRVKLASGLFEHPFPDEDRAKRVILSPEHLEAARQAAREGIVLLKNEGNLLPLSTTGLRLAVVGPLADDRDAPLGSWACLGRPADVISVLAGIREAMPGSDVAFAKGCAIDSDDTSGVAEAVKLAAQSDVVVLVVGESRRMSGEGGSRAFLGLPGRQLDLVKRVVATGKPTVVVLINGRPLAIPWIAEHATAILETWQLGVQHGRAVADVLFGMYNPSGKLPATFPRCVGQVPIFYNHKNTGRPPREDTRWTSRYVDAPSTPQFPFGFGLSYTKYEYRDLKIEPTQIGPAGTVHVSVTVENVGRRAGEEIVQLYIRDPVASVTRPVRELKGFRRVHLDPGESKRLSFELGPEELGFYNVCSEWVVEPGKFEVWVGPSSAEGLHGEFFVVD